MSEKKIIKLGAVEGRHPLPVETYVVPEGLTEKLTQLLSEGKVGEITDLVTKRCKVLLEPYIYQTYAAGINQYSYDDVGVYTSDTVVHLYLTGLTAVSLAVVRFCFLNGIPVVGYHYNRETGEYVPQPLL